MGSFNRHDKFGIVYYTVPSLEKTGLVTHAFTTRNGGVSREAYDSLNLSILTEDPLENVLENRRRLADVLGFSVGDIVGAWQVHKDNIFQVTSRDRGRGSVDPLTVIPDTDALITREKGLVLTAFFADCVPVIFLDPVNEAIGIAHAGWKGTAAKIGAKTVSAMTRAFGSEPDKLLAAIGPSIGACHYQVDEPVIKRFREEFPDDFRGFFSGEEKGGHAWLDLWKANVQQLKKAGIPDNNISVSGLCTYCNQQELFSHRAGSKGRQAALIMLKP